MGDTGNLGAKSISQEIALLIAELRNHWLQPLNEPLTRSKRFTYALVGSATWVFATFLMRIQSESMVRIWLLLFRESAIWVIMAGMAVLIPLWFAWLVSWRERSIGPIRLFLEGIILPTLVGFVLSYSQPDSSKRVSEPTVTESSRSLGQS